MRGIDDQGHSLGELVQRLVEQAKAYARAQLALVKQIAAAKAGKAATGAALAVAAIMLAQAGLIALVAALGLCLARWLNLDGGMAVAALITLAIAGFLGWSAAQRLAKLGEPE